MCVKTATVQSSMPTTNAFPTDSTCGGQCPQGTQCAWNAPLITYTCQSASNSSDTGGTTNCSGTNCNLNYVPLEPLPGSVPSGAYGDLGSYLNYLFPILITVGAILGVGTFTLYGVVYMTSSVVGDKSRAATRMKKSVWGLILLLGSVTILTTINPNLTNFADLSNLGSRLNLQQTGTNSVVSGSSGSDSSNNSSSAAPLQDAQGYGQQP